MKNKKILSLALSFMMILNIGNFSFAEENLNNENSNNTSILEETKDEQNNSTPTEETKDTTVEDIEKKHKNNISKNSDLYGSNLDNSIDENSELNAFLNSSTITKRISGTNRVNTSALISNFTNEKADKVIIADGRNYADALSGSSITFGEYPILLVDGNLSTDVTNEIIRLEAKEIIILGGEKSISLAVENTLAKLDNVEKVTRIAGANRYETSTLISSKSINNNLIIASGDNFPDALSSSILTNNNSDLVLTAKNDISPYLNKILSNFDGDDIKLIGGKSTISDSVLTKITNSAKTSNVTRIFGSNRYETSTKVASNISHDNIAVIASGESFPDALSASTLSQKINAPILLVSKNIIDDSIISYIRNYNIEKAIIIGGSSTISDNTLNNIDRLINGQDVIGNYNPITLSSYVVSNSEQNTYSNKSYDSKVNGKVRKNLIMKVLEQSDEWVKVNYDKTTGWVEKKHFSNYSAKSFGKVVNNVPYISQLKPVYAPNGCEPTSLLMGLQGKGYTNIGLKEFLDKMPKTTSNPAKGYVGTPYNTVQHLFQTIDPEPLAKYGQKYGNVVNIQGASKDDIIREIQNGNTVVAYVTLFWNQPYYRTLPIDGKNTSRIWNNHVLLITGYNPTNNSFYIADPYNHEKAGANRSKPFYYWKNANTVEKLYNIRKFAVVIR